ncbi:MAG: Mur ligase family protein [Bacteroidota bacterium]
MRSLSDFPDAHLRIFDRPPVPDAGTVRSVYLVGICGTGMGSLAGLFQQAGYEVSGSDKGMWPPMSTRLNAMQIPVHVGFDAAHLKPAPDLVIVGNACTPTHPEAAHARNAGLVQQSFPEALAHFFIRDRRSIVVAGTHGKTSTTGLLAHVMRQAGTDAGFLVGGVLVADDTSYHTGPTGRHFVVEGDEYDSAYFDKRPKFMHYRPTVGIVTSLEFDHADIYADLDEYREAFRRFAGLVGEHLVLCADHPDVEALAAFTPARVTRYGFSDAADVTAKAIERIDGGTQFTLVVNGTEHAGFVLPMSGRHNLSNALAVSAVALAEGLTPDQLRAGLASFQGMKRRQEVRGIVNDIVVVDDFAHHPTAVRATIEATRDRWPGRRLLAVFEPRSNSSRRKMFETEYPASFADADLAFLSSPPLRHNDRADDFMNVDAVAEAITAGGTRTFVGSNADQVLDALADATAPGDVVLIMSNGGFGNIHQRLLDVL